MRWVALVLPFLLSCGPLREFVAAAKEAVPPLPTRGMPTCEPEPADFLELARSEAHLPTMAEIPDDPAIAAEMAYERAAELGYTIKDKKGKGKLACMSTTVPEVPDGFVRLLFGLLEAAKLDIPLDVRESAIYRGTCFGDKDTTQEAITLWHEVTHAESQAERGGAKWLAGYAFAEIRYAYELQGVRAQYRVARRLGWTPPEGRTWAEEYTQRAVRLDDTYDLTGIPDECLERWTVEILSFDEGAAG